MVLLADKMMFRLYVIGRYITLHISESLQIREHTNVLIQLVFNKLHLCEVSMQRTIFFVAMDKTVY